MFFQIGCQVLDGHPVDARGALVGLHLYQCLLQIVTLDNRFHGRPDCRPAFDIGSRRAGFGLLGGGASGFTRCPGAQVQLELILLPHGPYEIAALLASSTVQAFAGCPATMPSADSCVAIRAPCDTRSPVAGTAAQASRGKIDRLRRTLAGFTTPTLDGRGLRDHLLARPVG